MKKRRWADSLWFLSTLLSVLSFVTQGHAAIQREYQFSNGQTNGQYVKLEFLSDDIVHVEYATGSSSDPKGPISTSPMVCDPNEPGIRELKVCTGSFDGPSQFVATEAKQGRRSFKTATLEISVDLNDLSLSFYKISTGHPLIQRLTPERLNSSWKGLAINAGARQDYYGLGQKFLDKMRTSGSFRWNGSVREGGAFGNVMEGFNGGNTGNTQIPVLFAFGYPSSESYALFLDNIYRQRWDFSGTTQNSTDWKVEMGGGQVRFYFINGNDPLSLRRTYLGLVGRPLVPPKKAFGLWVSEYGYENWQEVEQKLGGLRTNAFPIDGFVLDLQWFGGIKTCSDDTRMGSLSWDGNAFPNAQDRLRGYRDNDGLGFITIEETYIGRNLSEHQALASRGCLVTRCPGCSEPAYIGQGKGNCWWGSGGMLDYTKDVCGDFWHDYRRTNLIRDGVVGHWTDLGEPEVYLPESGYGAGTHADAHNIYNLKWTQSIFRGYVRNSTDRRPFSLSRSGAAGTQRYGAVMWSGDIGSRIGSLAAQFSTQANMSLSGVDYYGADIGGFFRHSLDGDLKELYTQWYAYGMLFDVPGRPHTDNSNCRAGTQGPCHETAPDRVGHLESNLANTRLRYRLIPYLYSLAHQAYQTGDPVFPPLLLHYPDDANVRDLAHEKMIGKDMLVALVARFGETQRAVYLPRGDWVDFHTGQKLSSQGQWFENIPVYENGLFRLPIYIREGAIIPQAYVDAQTMNALGRRRDRTIRDDMYLTVFPSLSGSDFKIFEDDGESLGYSRGQVQTRVVRQRFNGQEATITVLPSSGSFAATAYGGSTRGTRPIQVQVVGINDVTRVLMTAGKELPRLRDVGEFGRVANGWVQTGPTRFEVKVGDWPIDQELQLKLVR